MTKQDIIDWVIARLQEPSTYAGLASVVAALGLHLNGVDVDAITKFVMAGAGLAAIIVSDKKS